MIYVVNVDVEVEAETREDAEDMVIENFGDFYTVIREVKEI